MRVCWPPLLLLCGCLPPRIRSAADVDPIVREVRIEGNGGGFSGTSDYLVKTAMVQLESPRFWRIAPRERAVRLSRDELTRDAWRIETWYAHQGFFEARFLGWEVVERRPRKNRTPVVDLVGHVEEGPPTNIASVTWLVVDEQGHPTEQSFESVVKGPLARELRNRAAAQPGDRFTLAAHEETRDLTLLKLRDQSFAYAEVRGEVDVRADEHEADLRYLCQPGPACRFGEVTLTGASKVPRDLIRQKLAVREGQAFSARAIATTQRDLFALGTFSVVNVKPALDRPKPLPPSEGPVEPPPLPSDVVPVTIELQDSRWRQLRLGGGVAAQTGKQELRASAGFSHVNLGGRLLQLDVEALAGYTWLSSLADLVDTGDSATGEELGGGPLLSLGLGLDAPRLPVPALKLENDLSLDLGVEEAWQYVTPTFSTALTWSPIRHWTYGFGAGLRYYQWFNASDSVSGFSTSGSELDTQNPYFLTTLSQTVLYDSRNDPVAPARGSYVSLQLDEALPPGMFDFVRLEVEGRRYFPLGRLLDALLGWYPRATLGGRLGGGLIQTYELFGAERAGVPFDERLTLGGSNSVRGWQDGHLGPYAWSCDAEGGNCYSDPSEALCAPGESCDTATIPTGGLVSSFGSLELRTYLPGQWDDYGFVVFADAGMVWWDLQSVGQPAPQLSLGVGLRYRTPVGPLRIDVARRMGDPVMFDHEPRWAPYFSLSEAF